MTTAGAVRSEDVTVTADKMGRPVVVLPDDAACWLTEASRAGWSEVLGMGYGHSRAYDPATPEHAAAVTILAAVVEDDPNHCAPGTTETARRGSFYGHIVGRSAWDTETEWWSYAITDPAHQALTCSGSLHVRNHWTGPAHWAGPVQWVG